MSTLGRGTRQVVYRILFLGFATSLGLTGCGGQHGALPATPAPPFYLADGEAQSGQGNLFVVNAGPESVTKFAVNGRLKATITQGLDEPTLAAVGSDGSLYVRSSNWISVYARGKVSPTRTITGEFGSFALGADDLLYAFTQPGDQNVINIYQAGSGTVWRSITGLEAPAIGFAFDSLGDLYALENDATKTTSFCAISEYGPQGGSLIRTIKKGLNRTFAIAVDKAGRLYALNMNSVTVYPAGEEKPSMTIRAGIIDPSAMAVDAKSRLYIANGSGTVAIYRPGSTTPSRTIKDPHKPRALVFDHDGNLYVGNALSVSVYKSGTTKLIMTIQKWVRGVRNLAFGP